MRRVIASLTACLLFAGIPTAAASHQHGNGNGKKEKKEHAGGPQDMSGSTAAVHVVFTTGEVAILRTHYAPNYRNLPPGLQKKVARGGQLPPGWQKKFAAFPDGVERQLQPLPAGYRRGVIDAHAVIFNSRTNVIVDAAVLF